MAEPHRRPSLLDALAVGPLVLDAGMGTRLMARGLDLAVDDSSLWNLSHPEIVASLHLADLRAGADVLLTNTFSANRDWLARFGRAHDFETINRQAVALARGLAPFEPYLLGSIGPAHTTIGSVREQADILADEGVDAILLETFRFKQAAEALEAIGNLAGLPIFISLIDWTAPYLDQVKRLEDLGASAIGANCISGLERVAALAERLREVTKLPILMKPSAGLPGEKPVSPRKFGKLASGLIALGVEMIGGCCGTNEDHVAAVRQACYDSRRS